MRRQVRDPRDRFWTLHSEMQWRTSDPDDDFEHDFSSGHAAAVVLLILVIVLFAVLIVWTPPKVVVPLWVILLLLLVVLFFPLRWVLRRPWAITAATGDKGEDDEMGVPIPEETWAGTVRGPFNMYKQMGKIERNIREEAMPAMEGPLKPAG
jgi:hypothetical protein